MTTSHVLHVDPTHTQGHGWGHVAIPHGGHVGYLRDGHRHASLEGHRDDH
jgi:hypothetical protein